MQIIVLLIWIHILEMKDGNPLFDNNDKDEIFIHENGYHYEENKNGT